MKALPDSAFIPRESGYVQYSGSDLGIAWESGPSYVSQTFTTAATGEYVFEIRYHRMQASSKTTKRSAIKALGQQPFLDIDE